MDILKNEEDLLRIAEIREKIAKEKSSIDFQLSKESTLNLEKASKSLDTLTTTQLDVKLLKADLSKIEHLSHAADIERYETINQVTRLHGFLDRTTEIYDKITNVGSICALLDEMLQHCENVDPLVNDIPLLRVHYVLGQLRDFEEQCREMATNDDTQRTVSKVFQGVSELVKRFERVLEGIIFDLVEAVRSESPVVADFSRIAQYEVSEDAKITEILQVVDSRRDKVIKVGTSRAKTTRIKEILNGTIQHRLQPRGLKQFIVSTIQQSIQDQFRNMLQEFPSFEVLGQLDWILNELIVVKQHLVWPTWDIFEDYFGCYQSELTKLLDSLIQQEPETVVILDIIDFDKSFCSVLKKELGISIPTLISNKESLLDDYLSLIVTKMTQWIDNLKKTELEVFEKRLTAPEQDDEGRLALEGTRIVFQMFTQQVDVAAGSQQGKILVGVIQHFSKILLQRQQAWMALVLQEVNREDPAPGLQDYLVALANDQIRAADWTEALSQKYASWVSSKYSSQITHSLETALDGFADLAKFAVKCILKLIYQDLSVPLGSIFTKSWYSGGIEAQQISDTLFEYISEVKQQMNMFLFDNFMEECIEMLLVKYLENTWTGHHWKAKKFHACITRDFDTFYKLFSQFCNADVIAEKFVIVEFFIDLVSMEHDDEILAVWAKTIEHYNDIPEAFLEQIIKNRKDVGSSRIKPLLLRAHALQRGDTPSFMGSIHRNPHNS